MRHKLLHCCPVCQQEMAITKLECSHCNTKIEGEFEPCKFCRLPSDQMEFLEVFLQCRGNLKDIEKGLGISYPTIRNRLDTVLRNLGYQDTKEEPQVEQSYRQEILESLEKGEITTVEATLRLRKLKK
ncbi:DUF2089 domain-containing protein [Acetonema longum]|uniref:DUF2089 domain-containing protein n=1 Tax=Acetonema longum DSM 6540 TaxID=1009370 RepID=F7NG96_9FIRM|nr:DUF2089 domain-containing protein [Acetonema longum]EGO65014.1 hypothetical protein ALO_05413 [Acetonema longum DSM 6540]